MKSFTRYKIFFALLLIVLLAASHELMAAKDDKAKHDTLIFSIKNDCFIYWSYNLSNDKSSADNQRYVIRELKKGELIKAIASTSWLVQAYMEDNTLGFIFFDDLNEAGRMLCVSDSAILSDSPDITASGSLQSLPFGSKLYFIAWHDNKFFKAKNEEGVILYAKKYDFKPDTLRFLSEINPSHYSIYSQKYFSKRTKGKKSDEIFDVFGMPDALYQSGDSSYVWCLHLCLVNEEKKRVLQNKVVFYGNEIVSIIPLLIESDNIIEKLPLAGFFRNANMNFRFLRGEVYAKAGLEKWLEATASKALLVQIFIYILFGILLILMMSVPQILTTLLMIVLFLNDRLSNEKLIKIVSFSLLVFTYLFFIFSALHFFPFNAALMLVFTIIITFFYLLFNRSFIRNRRCPSCKSYYSIAERRKIMRMMREQEKTNKRVVEKQKARLHDDFQEEINTVDRFFKDHKQCVYCGYKWRNK